MKIRSVGLNLSGGRGLAKFLLDSNFSTKFFYDWSTLKLETYSETLNGAIEYLEIFDDYFDAIVDIPFCFAYEYLYNKDNSTKFIYIKRDIDSWTQSFKNTQIRYSHSTPRIFEELFCNFYAETNKTKMQDLTEEEIRNIYVSHDAAIMSFFENKENFIVIDLNDLEISNKLKTFLSIDNEVVFTDISVA
jgi:hypothetical protein